MRRHHTMAGFEQFGNKKKDRLLNVDKVQDRRRAIVSKITAPEEEYMDVSGFFSFHESNFRLQRNSSEM